MKVKFKKLPKETAGVYVIPVFSDKEVNLTGELEVLYNHLKESGKFIGKASEIFSNIIYVNSEVKDVIFVGLGMEAAVNETIVKNSFSKVIKKLRDLKAQTVYLELLKSDSMVIGSWVKAIVEGLCLGDYKFDRYRSDKTKYENIEVCIGNTEEAGDGEIDDFVKEAKIVTAATVLARNLVNEPANSIYPESLAKDVKKFGKEFGFEVEVLNEDEIEKLEMKAFLEVGKGSKNAPRLIVMRYFGDEDNKAEILGLVGKGLTYDSGGYSLKPTDGMVTMKSDMAGAAAVIGAIGAIAKRQLKINVIGVVAACENLISGGAYKPGDIIDSMAGKTIEILNTDAEGRLTLADAVTYCIQREKASRIVDIATLTGAVLVALGTTVTGAITNNDEFFNKVELASKEADEKLWRLPAFDDYKKLIKSDIADLKNTGGRNAGTITAGLFIGEFAGETPWVHLDIAGTSWSDNEHDYISKGGTGVGVKTLYNLAKNSVI